MTVLIFGSILNRTRTGTIAFQSGRRRKSTDFLVQWKHKYSPPANSIQTMTDG